jgi:cell division septation protein DedD
VIRAAVAALLLIAPHAALATVETGAAKWRVGDWSGAIAEWTTPAARGDPEALFNMGQAYRLGRGVPPSTATAIDYYRRAADKGHVGATTNLGITLYQEGRKTEGLNQLRTAADLGDLRAAYVLGVATFGGDGTPRNPALGYAYVVRARDGGLALASGQAARMATRMSEEDRAKGDAAAAALASGRSSAVVLAEMGVNPATAEARAAPVPDDEAEDAAEAEAARAPDRPARQTTAAATPAKTPEKAPPAKAKQQEAKTAAPATDGKVEGWKVQLGAYNSTRAARTAWATLVSQSAATLDGRSPVYAEKGGLIRLQVGPFEERADAAALCTKLAASGRPCFVTR